MKTKGNISINLTSAEKGELRRRKLRIVDILELAVDELQVLLDVPFERAREIHALVEFQQVPSVGIRFAEDLVFLGYYTLDALKDKDGSKLVEAYETKKGYWIDPCVEDQFRLVVHYANHGNTNKKWWDFTEERKRYRLEHGYSSNRPKTPWHEVIEIKRKEKPATDLVQV